ncbi:hypothetical protein L596_006454 [Steinernema carpocapsae]|uniref:VM domain-containing protein n=1 Tax=Steinernema carpocapsae TaxID=34508 RepID=A0A4U8V4F4_STECR|nr:hypothetical protein L596_006454 [Steinernema carpocapsae]
MKALNAALIVALFGLALGNPVFQPCYGGGCGVHSMPQFPCIGVACPPPAIRQPCLGIGCVGNPMPQPIPQPMPMPQVISQPMPQPCVGVHCAPCVGTSCPPPIPRPYAADDAPASASDLPRSPLPFPHGSQHPDALRRSRLSSSRHPSALHRRLLPSSACPTRCSRSTRSANSVTAGHATHASRIQCIPCVGQSFIGMNLPTLCC